MFEAATSARAAEICCRRSLSTRDSISTMPTRRITSIERFNQAYVAAGSPNGPLNAGATARERGLGRAFGFANPYRVGGIGDLCRRRFGRPGGTPLDLNLANPITCAGSTSVAVR